MNYEAIFCDETEEYRIPAEPEAGSSVTLRMRTAKDDVNQVWLATYGGEQELTKAYSEGDFDYYETQLQIGEEPVCYWFCISGDQEFIEYNRLGVSSDKNEAVLFHIVPGGLRVHIVEGFHKGQGSQRDHAHYGSGLKGTGHYREDHS